MSWGVAVSGHFQLLFPLPAFATWHKVTRTPDDLLRELLATATARVPSTTRERGPPSSIERYRDCLGVPTGPGLGEAQRRYR